MSTLKVNTILSETPNVTITDGLNVTGVSTVANITATTVTSTNIVNATPLTNRNLIINGAMQLAQRGTSQASITTSGYYNIDRFRTALNTGTVTTSQSTDVPTGEGFSKSFKVDVTTADTSLSGTNFLHVQQAIEGQNLQSLAYGTSGAKTITLSFFVKSNKTGIYCISLEKSDNTRYDFTSEYTINSADTWEQKTITISPDSNIQASAGAIDNDNDKGFNLKFCLAAGGDRDNGVNNTWNSSTPAHSTSNQVNLLDSTSNEWYLTGVQLELGSVATPFEHRGIGDELVRCQRYFQKISRSSNANSINGTFAAGTCNDNGSSGGILQVMVRFQTTMRAVPTMTQSGTFSHHVSGVNVADTTVAFDQAYIDGVKCTGTQTAFVSADGSCGELTSKYSDTSTAIINASAEL